MIKPAKLKKGDEVRIVAPSRSLKILSDDGVHLAKKRLEAMGLTVTFGKHVKEYDLQKSSPISSRVEDLHDAFSDSNVKGILTVIGGFNSNEVLPHLDYELIKTNPKIFCGFSDITALATAITNKCGFITYSGPHFSSFQMDHLQEYQTEFFINCLMQDEEYHVHPSKYWSDDLWYIDQENRCFEQTEWKVYTEGQASGTLFGGNLCTLNLLQGTDYMPNLKDCILFVEDDELTMPEIFARDLASLIQATGTIKGLLIGRFQKSSNVSEEHLHFVLDKYPQLKHIPVLYDLDFGHTQPMMTLPIGGDISIDTKKVSLQVSIF